MIVEGQSGAGKTTLIAKIAENISIWKPKTLVITRYDKKYLFAKKHINVQWPILFYT